MAKSVGIGLGVSRELSFGSNFKLEKSFNLHRNSIKPRGYVQFKQAINRQLGVICTHKTSPSARTWVANRPPGTRL